MRINGSVEAFALPIGLDVFLLILTLWNALDRPRRTQTTLMKQLYLDGIIYFCITTSLRMLNVVVIAKASIAYTQLSLYFFWAMIGLVLNRMLLVAGQAAYEVQVDDTIYGRVTPVGQQASPFLFQINKENEDQVYPYSFVELTDRSSSSYNKSMYRLS